MTNFWIFWQTILWTKCLINNERKKCVFIYSETKISKFHDIDQCQNGLKMSKTLHFYRKYGLPKVDKRINIWWWKRLWIYISFSAKNANLKAKSLSSTFFKHVLNVFKTPENIHAPRTLFKPLISSFSLWRFYRHCAMYACELKAIVCMIFLLILFQSIDFVFQLFCVCFFRSSLCYLVHLHCCFMQYVFLAWTLHQFNSFNSFSLFIISICIGG